MVTAVRYAKAVRPQTPISEASTRKRNVMTCDTSQICIFSTPLDKMKGRAWRMSMVESIQWHSRDYETYHAGLEHLTYQNPSNQYFSNYKRLTGVVFILRSSTCRQQRRSRYELRVRTVVILPVVKDHYMNYRSWK